MKRILSREVEIKQLPAAALETGFELDFERDTFKDTEIRTICTCWMTAP